MRTNIVIDDKLMRDALRATHLKTKREAVEQGLRTLLRLSRQAEIRRVLKSTGSLIMMVYAKHSLNYQVSIRIIRRLGLALLMPVPGKLPDIYERHRENARKVGLANYLRLHNFVHRSTDGPDNPYSKVYTVRELERDFPNFRIAETFKLWMHAPPLPSRRLPGERLLGWHLWGRLEPQPV